MLYRCNWNGVGRVGVWGLLLIFVLVQSSRVYAQATQLTFSGAPTVTAGSSGNTGSMNTKARWVNVATVNGVAVDMEAVILANSVATNNSVSWSTVSGQAKVALVGEGDQSVDLAYHFYQTGTNTPVVVAPEVIFRGLDGGLRQEVIQTLKTQIAKYTLDSTSSISVSSVLNGAGASDDEYKFTSTSGTNLVTNSGFESGNTGFTSSYTYLGEHGNNNSIAQGSWGEGKYAWFNDNRTPNSSNSYFNLTTANNGDAFLVVDIGNDTTHPFWQTSLSLTPGKNYVFSAFLANINDSNSNIKPNVNFVLTNSGGTSVLAPSGNLNTGGASLTPWQEVTSSFTASVASNTLALISNTAGLFGNDLAMDDVEVREVLPENQTGLSLTLQPASVFYFTFKKSNGLGEFALDGSLSAFFSSPQATLVDTTAPATPSVTSLTTTDTTPVLSGSAEAYSSVTLSVGGATYATSANGSGAWSVDTGTATPASGAFAPLTNGAANSVQVVSTDAAGNASSPGTGTLIIQVPAASNSSITPSPSTIAATGNATTTITVQAKNASNSNLTVGGSSVVLSTNLGSLGSVIDNGDGTYTASLTSATAPGTATITGTINGQAMTAATVNFVALALGINTVAGDDFINLSEDDSSVAVTGSSAGVEAGRTLTLTSFSAQNSGNFSAPQVSGAGSAQLALGAGYLALTPSWGATTNVISTRASVGPLNLTGANYSVDVWLPAAYVTNGQLTLQPYLQDSSGRTAAITQRAASSLTGNSWNSLSLNNISLGNLSAVTSGFDLTAVTYLGLQLSANGKPTSVVGDVRWDNLLVSQPASGAPVNFTFAASQTYSASIGADGSWAASIPATDAQALAAASLLVADVSNQAGDFAPQARRSISHTLAAPVITIAAVTGDDAVSTSEDDSAVSFTGTASNVESGQTVTLSLNGTSYTGTVSAGSWSVSVPGSALQILSGTVAVTANVANQA
ncbi:MAG TPA: invasin domain 3-containing protein, partial [Marinagarivorans sp.]|nr:invasin domain 3-containing protein [Marinagarivorans sp.]